MHAERINEKIPNHFKEIKSYNLYHISTFKFDIDQFWICGMGIIPYHHLLNYTFSGCEIWGKCVS